MTNTQKLTTGNKTEITFPTYDYGNFKSMTFVSTHTSSLNVSLWITSQINTDITNTGVLAAQDKAISTSSTVLNVDTVLPTNDVFVGEKVYKSDGKLFGTATAVADASPDTVTFGSGINNAITDDDPLYTGTTYYILKSIALPKGVGLKLNHEDFSFSNDTHKLYAKSSNAGGLIDIIIR